MDEDVSIINSNTRNEKVKSFFNKHKKKIISTLIFFIILIICVFIFENYKSNKKKDISEKYNLITINYNQGTKDERIKSLIDIINKKDPTYSPLSLYYIIDNQLITDQDQINNFFDIIIEKISLDKEIKNLTIYKKALFNADNINEGELLNMLNPLINSKSIWKSHALYLIAEYFYAKNQKEKAKEFFNQIISLENPNPDIRLQTDKRLNRDLSD